MYKPSLLTLVAVAGSSTERSKKESCAIVLRL